MAKKPSSAPAESNVDPRHEAEALVAYRDLKAEVARIGQKIAAMFGRYEKFGVDPKVVKALYSLEQKENPAAWQRKIMASAVALGIFGDQGDFSDLIAAPRLDAETKKLMTHQMIRQNGYDSGFSGGNKNHNKHPAGSEEHVIWAESFNLGWADRAALKPEAAEETKPAPRSRKGAAAAAPAAAAPAEPAPAPADKPKRGRPPKKAATAALPPLYQEEAEPEPEPSKGPPLAYTVGDDEVEIIH